MAASPAGATSWTDYFCDFSTTSGARLACCLWRPGAVGRWAEQFSEEQIELWAARPSENPARLASEFNHTHQEQAFIEEHAEIWLISMTSISWEIFARYRFLLDKVRDNLQGHATIRVYVNDSKDRGRAYAKAGIAHVWRAMHGQAN